MLEATDMCEACYMQIHTMLCLCNSGSLIYTEFCVLQLQHAFAVLGKTGRSTCRTALTELRQEYERSYKYSGKV